MPKCQGIQYLLCNTLITRNSFWKRYNIRHLTDSERKDNEEMDKISEKNVGLQITLLVK